MQSLFRGKKDQHFSVDRLEALHLELVELVTTGKPLRRIAPFRSILKDEPPEDRLLSRSAFRDIIVKASSSSDGNGSTAGTDTTDDTDPFTTIPLAELEKLVTTTIYNIGETLLQEPEGCARLACLEYFRENKVLQYMIEIATDQPLPKHSSQKKVQHSCLFHQVTWSSLVKSSILRTLSLLVSRADSQMLVFVLSQNCVNHLLLCLTPLEQWTDPALEIILPAFVQLLGILANQLRANPFLFPLLVLNAKDSSQSCMPVLTGALEALQCSYSHSASFSHVAGLNLLVDLMQFDQIQIFIRADEQEVICEHFCRLFLDRFERFKTLISGPVVNGARSNALKHQINGLDDHLDLLNDVFTCDIQELNVCLCETILDRLVSVLLQHFSAPTNRHFATVGVLDNDVIPPAEADSQAAVYFYSRLLHRVSYAPLFRMLTVTLLHPQSSPLWSDVRPDTEQYPLTTSLQAVVNGTAIHCPNPWRAQLVDALRGDYGEWRLVPVAVLVEVVIKSPLMDTDTLTQLSVISPYDAQWQGSAVETAVATFLECAWVPKSEASTMALQCMSTLAMELVYCAAAHLAKTCDNPGIYASALEQSLLRNSLRAARDRFFEQTIRSSEAIGVADIFVDLVETAVKSRYKRVGATNKRALDVSVSYSCILSQFGAESFAINSEILIRSQRAVTLNEVELTRFFAGMAIHFRAVCRTLSRFDTLSQGCRSKRDRRQAGSRVVMVDNLDELAAIFDVQPYGIAGTDVDIRGRMVFRFTSQARWATGDTGKGDGGDRQGHLIVLDPTSMLIVTPISRGDTSRCNVYCTVSLLRIIATARDDAWLHIAVKHHDMGELIKNGNIALRFESAGTCLIVAQYLDRCRQVLRGEVFRNIRKIFTVEKQCLEEDTAPPNATEASTS